MADLNGGVERPRIFDRKSLNRWLRKLQYDRRRQPAVVIAARAALRVLPLIALGADGQTSRQHAWLPFAVLWASALARVAAKYPTRANELRASAATAASAVDAAFADAAAAAAAAAGAAADAAFTDSAGPSSVAAALAADAADSDAATIWRSISADVTALEEGRSPSDLAGDPLWPQRAPDWAAERWARLREVLADEHWRPWLDWYQRRLDGRELSEEIELLFATLPVDPREKDPAEQNALLAREIARLTPSSPPEIPGQGAGPHVEIDPETGVIVPAKPESLDAEGNNIARLRALHPQVARLARGLVASISANEQPELHGSASRYADNVDRDLRKIDFDQLWGEGVFLEARAAAAAKGATDGVREPLDATTLSTLNALLEVHGPFILSSRAGLENLALSREFHQRAEEAREEEAATRELAREFKNSPDIVSPETAQLFEHIVEQPESSVHPERSGAFKAGMTRNVLINVTAAATIGTIVGGAGAIYGPVGGAVAGSAAYPLVEGWKKSKPFLQVANLVTGKLDDLSEAEIRDVWARLRKVQFDRYTSFVLKHEKLLRRALGDREQARWLHEHLDWLKRVSENGK